MLTGVGETSEMPLGGQGEEQGLELHEACVIGCGDTLWEVSEWTHRGRKSAGLG